MKDFTKACIYLDSAESTLFFDPELVNTAIEQRKYDEAFDAYHHGKMMIYLVEP
jgi:hypothetical protein